MTLSKSISHFVESARNLHSKQFLSYTGLKVFTNKQWKPGYALTYSCRGFGTAYTRPGLVKSTYSSYLENRLTFENQTWYTIKRVSLEHFDTIFKIIFFPQDNSDRSKMADSSIIFTFYSIFLIEHVSKNNKY